MDMRYLALLSTGLLMTGCCIPPEELHVSGAPGDQVMVYTHPGAMMVDAATPPEELHAQASNLRQMGMVAKARSVETLAKAASQMDLELSPAKIGSPAVFQDIASARRPVSARSIVITDADLEDEPFMTAARPRTMGRSALTQVSGMRAQISNQDWMRMQRQLSWIESDIANTSSAIAAARRREAELQTLTQPSLVDQDRSIADMDYTTVGPDIPQGLPVNRDRFSDVAAGILPGGLPLPSDVMNAASMLRSSEQVGSDISALQEHLKSLQAQRSQLRAALGMR